MRGINYIKCKCGNTHPDDEDCDMCINPINQLIKDKLKEFDEKFLSKNRFSSVSQFNNEVSGKLPRLFKDFLKQSLQKAYESGQQSKEIL